MQLIHPKLVNRQHHPPATTSHASSPPSGKSAGFTPPATGAAFGIAPPFSKSASASAVPSGKIFASVSLFWLPSFSRAGSSEFLAVSISLSSKGVLVVFSVILLPRTMDEDEDPSSLAMEVRNVGGADVDGVLVGGVQVIYVLV